jgi:hypothetical protein
LDVRVHARQFANKMRAIIGILRGDTNTPAGRATILSVLAKDLAEQSFGGRPFAEYGSG